jgi:uncharacterized membrane protein YeiH
VLAGLAMFQWGASIERMRGSVLIFDAAGLALFAAVLFGMLTGIGGGMVRDVLSAEAPAVLRGDVYAVAALAGAAVVVVGRLLHVPDTAATLIGAALCFAIRFAAIRHGWQLPLAGRATPSTIPRDEA